MRLAKPRPDGLMRDAELAEMAVIVPPVAISSQVVQLSGDI